MIIKNADFLRTNFVIAIDFLSFIVVVKLNGSIIVFKKSLKQVKNEACQVLESFVSNIVSFLKEWRKILKGAILCRKSIEWVTLLVRSNLIMSAKKKSNLWDSQMHQKVLRTSEHEKALKHKRFRHGPLWTDVDGTFHKKISRIFWFSFTRANFFDIWSLCQ